jgi:hypothetical protein
LKVLLLWLLLVSVAFADPLEDAFADDPIARALAVSSGELRFLPAAPAKPAHHHTNRLEITARSLEDGWVRLEQCHSDLDPVPESEIIFRPGRIRDLQLGSFHGIGAAAVEGASVQLQDVRRGAGLCLSAETQALEQLGQGMYELRSGPYMRRFLDGYYPMRVTLDIRYPAALELVDHIPDPQPGFEPQREAQRILLDTWFEGILETRFRFLERDPASPPARP